jgi:hypothetical protein
MDSQGFTLKDGISLFKKVGQIIIIIIVVVVVVAINNTMHKFAPLLYSYMLAPTCIGSSLPSLGSFWIRLSYVEIQIDMAVYHIMWLNGLCVGVSWFSLLYFPTEDR